MYASPQFFNLSSYELVLKDVRYMHELAPDLIILDEAQRIRNWTTATARTIKQLKSRYAFVLTGTPLENKLEELFSVVEFIDGRRLGPAFRFLHEHRTEDEHGKLIGYRGLDKIHDQLAPILLRRTRQEVLKDLPKRTDQILHVALTPQQAEPYWEQNDILGALMRKWERQGWLSEIDQKRILCCLQNMRMLCNSTFLFDKQTNHSPKLAEFREIVRELAMEEGRKVVVFSEYERMTYLAGQELEKLGIGFVSLHGSVPSRNRGALMEKFRRDSELPRFPFDGCGRGWVESPGGLGGGQFRAAVESRPARTEDRASPPARPGASGPRGASADQGQHRRARVGHAQAEEISVRRSLRLADGRGELRRAWAKEHPAGSEGDLHGSTGAAKATDRSSPGQSHPHTVGAGFSPGGTGYCRRDGSASNHRIRTGCCRAHRNWRAIPRVARGRGAKRSR